MKKYLVRSMQVKVNSHDIDFVEMGIHEEFETLEAAKEYIRNYTYFTSEASYHDLKQRFGEKLLVLSIDSDNDQDADFYGIITQ